MLFDVKLHCASCEERVKEDLFRQDGVLDVRAYSDREEVEVEFDRGEVDTDGLRSLIEEMDYEANLRSRRTMEPMESLLQIVTTLAGTKRPGPGPSYQRSGYSPIPAQSSDLSGIDREQLFSVPTRDRVKIHIEPSSRK